GAAGGGGGAAKGTLSTGVRGWTGPRRWGILRPSSGPPEPLPLPDDADRTAGGGIALLQRQGQTEIHMDPKGERGQVLPQGQWFRPRFHQRLAVAGYGPVRHRVQVGPRVPGQVVRGFQCLRDLRVQV